MKVLHRRIFCRQMIDAIINSLSAERIPLNRFRKNVDSLLKSLAAGPLQSPTDINQLIGRNLARHFHVQIIAESPFVVRTIIV